jgi:ABC-2 type transport system permease protein
MTGALEEYDSASRPPRFLEELRDLRGNGALIRALVERNIKVRYKRSVLGVFWTMLNPAAMLLVVSLVFTRAFASAAPAYPLFALPGVLLWNFFAQSTMMVAAEMAGGVDLWRRIRIPKTALAISTILTGLVNLAFALIPLIIILVVLRRPVGRALLTLPLTVALTAGFILGAALLLSTAALYFPDVADAYAILLPALMFAAPVIYPSSIVPPLLRHWLRFNPMTLYIEAFRTPLYANASPTAGAIAAMVTVSATSLITGWLLFTRTADELPYRA